uniref:Uncharacterized protein n=1 Tax=Arundo donax TaxID=35708 RepID=A0A0A8YI84_ARUDO
MPSQKILSCLLLLDGT